MPEARLHDGSTIEIEVHGAGPALLLPIDPRPVEGPAAEELRKYGADPALGRSLIEGLSDAFRVVAFDYQGQVTRTPKPETLTPDNAVADLLAVADAAGVERFAYYGYSWLAVIGLQLAIRTGRLTALIMGGFPPLDAPYADMLRVTTVAHEMAVAAKSAAQSTAGSGQRSDAPTAQAAVKEAKDSEWSTVSLSEDQTRQFVTLYQALQDFDDRAAQARLTCPRLCFVGSADEIQYGKSWGDVHLNLAEPIVRGRADLEALGWDVVVLDGLNHMQAMQAAQVVPILRSWLPAQLASQQR
ncbi:MAG TPA: alpha/beta hydrolase [Chloroflexota bacterium]|nr:alpha/beta hydrolase [Chloroflexota bacterium]